MNDLIKSFEARGWEFTEDNYHWIFFVSPRMKETIGKRALCPNWEINNLTEEKIKEAEVDMLVEEWEADLIDKFYENIAKDMSRQYKILLMKDMEPPRSQKISFDVEWKL